MRTHCINGALIDYFKQVLGPKYDAELKIRHQYLQNEADNCPTLYRYRLVCAREFLVGLLQDNTSCQAVLPDVLAFFKERVRYYRDIEYVRITDVSHLEELRSAILPRSSMPITPSKRRELAHQVDKPVKQRKRADHWTKEEEKIFLKYWNSNTKNFQAMAAEIGTRSRAQCNEKWQNAVKKQRRAQRKASMLGASHQK